jgi:hypothetical protein
MTGRVESSCRRCIEGGEVICLGLPRPEHPSLDELLTQAYFCLMTPHRHLNASLRSVSEAVSVKGHHQCQIIRIVSDEGLVVVGSVITHMQLQ